VTAESREALLFDYLDQLIYERDVRLVLPPITGVRSRNLMIPNLMTPNRTTKRCGRSR